MSLYILITLVIILVALGIFCYTRKNRGPYLSSTPIYKEDKLIPITDPDIIKQRQAADRMKKWLDDETERQSRHLDILNYNAVVRNNLLSFINDVEQLNEFWLFLNRNFQLWPNGTNNRYLLPMRHIPYIVSYERTDAQINFILNLVNGVNLIFNIFPTYVEGVRIKATLEFKCRYTDDINEQPVAIYEYVCDKEIRNSLLNNNVKFVSHMCTELRSALNLVYHNDKIDYLFAGHAFYMHGITINEIQPFLRSDCK